MRPLRALHAFCWKQCLNLETAKQTATECCYKNNGHHAMIETWLLKHGYIATTIPHASEAEFCC